MPNAAPPIPVIILTGFLGAGKTTLLNQLLHDPALSEAAVIINELGKISLDHLLVEEADDEVIELSSGCLCCTMRGALVDTLDRLVTQSKIRKAPLSAIIIETTGIADPVPVMQSVIARGNVDQSLVLGEVVTVVDAVNGEETLREYEQATRQVVLADSIFLSKTEMVKTSVLNTLKSTLEKLNPSVTPLSTAKIEAADVLALATNTATLTRDFSKLSAADPAHQKAFSTITIESSHAISRSAFDAFLELVSSSYGTAILRMKGLILTQDHPDKPLVVHGVQSMISPPEIAPEWPNRTAQTRLVFIADGSDLGFIRQLFDSFSGKPTLDTPDRDAMTDNPLAISGHAFR